MFTWERALRAAKRKELLLQIDDKLAEWSELPVDRICANTIAFIKKVLPGAYLYTALVKVGHLFYHLS